MEYETRPGVLVDPTKWDSEEEIEPYMLWAVEYLRDSIQQLGEQGCLNNDISSEGWVFEVREPVDGQTVLISEGLLIVPILINHLF